MGVIALQQNEDQLEAGEIRGLELIALRYTGDHSSLATRGALASQGKWPGTAPLNNGVWYFALVPDEGLAYLENRDDLDLIYADDAEAFAAALLEKNRLPGNAFGRRANLDLQDRVFDALGIKDPMEAGPVEAQLRELAGVDAPDEDDAGDDGRAASLVDKYSRGQLKAAVKELREDTDEFSLQGAGVTDMAEFLTEQDEAAVHDALAADDADEDGGDN
jgi:hypothetical protein